MSETIKAITNLFTGKGGTLRLAIFVSLSGATIYEIINSNYNLEVKTSNGTSFRLAPTTESPVMNRNELDSTTDENITVNTEISNLLLGSGDINQ